MAQRQIPQYYVYEHWRLDKDECFYVGKGKGKRAYETSRENDHWNNIVAKLERIGSGYEIRMVKTGLTEKEAFRLERERIAFWRDKVDLSNKTDGGEGTSGMKHTAEAKAKMSAIHIGNQHAKGHAHTEEFKKRQSIRMTQKPPTKNPLVAQKISEGLKALGDSHPTKRSEVKAKISASRKGKCVGSKNGFYRKSHLKETIEAMRLKRIGQHAGSKHANSKLTENDVIEILKSSEKQDNLALKYNVSRGLISAIKTKRAWKHVAIAEVA